MKIEKLLLIVSMFCFIGLSAQNTNDIVYLKSGSFIKGEVIENIVGEYVKIKTFEGDVRQIKFDEIKEIKLNYETGIEKVGDQKDFNKGFYTIVDFGVTVSSSYSSFSNPIGSNLFLVNGYHISEKIATGIGLGIEGMTEPLMPLFLEGKYTFSTNGLSPEFRLQAGYSLPLDSYYYSSNSGGLLLSPLFGIRNFGRYSGFVFSIGYRFQNLYSKNIDWQDILVKENRVFNRFTFRIGIVF